MLAGTTETASEPITDVHRDSLRCSPEDQRRAPHSLLVDTFTSDLSY